MFVRLRRRITFTILGIIAIVFAIAIIAFISIRYRIEYDSIEKTLENPQIGFGPSGHDEGGGDPRLFVNAKTYTVIVEDDGSLISPIDDSIDQDVLEDVINIVLKSGSNKGTINKYYLLYRCEEGAIGGSYIISFASIESAQKNLSSMIWISICLYVSILIIFYFISHFISKIIVKPVKETWESQKQFIQDASHDLKTPLTVILANQDIILSDDDKKVTEKKEWIESTKEEALMMKNLVEKMLESARTENMIGSLVLDDCNISELTEKVVLQFDAVAFDKEIIIDDNIEENIIHKSSSEEYVRLVHILIDNAIKYSPKNERITISLSRIITKMKQGFVFRINNKGEGIPKEDLEHIFERFYRADKSRSSGSYGLGLSIAKNICNSLGGSINVTSSIEEGTTFELIFK